MGKYYKMLWILMNIIEHYIITFFNHKVIQHSYKTKHSVLLWRNASCSAVGVEFLVVWMIYRRLLPHVSPQQVCCALIGWTRVVQCDAVLSADNGCLETRPWSIASIFRQILRYFTADSILMIICDSVRVLHVMEIKHNGDLVPIASRVCMWNIS